MCDNHHIKTQSHTLSLPLTTSLTTGRTGSNYRYTFTINIRTSNSNSSSSSSSTKDGVNKKQKQYLSE